MNAETKQARKDFEGELNELSRRNSHSTVFNNFLDYALWVFNLSKTNEDDEAIMKQIGKESAENYARMLLAFSILADNNGIGFRDVLGDLFMDYVSHGNNGQYFTPDPICEMMSQITQGDPIEFAGKSVCDPSCGSGRMLLATGKRAAEKGVRNVRFFGCDIDPICCKMAVLNMLINTMCGEIAHMNTLSMEHWKSWHISRVLLDNGYWMPTYRVSGPGETDFVQRLQSSMQNIPQALDMPAMVMDAGSLDPSYKTDKRGQLFLF